eukprot:m.138145 g.138145  ORF g.138145 m.138145 type:complete len:69 (+) comp29973_c2_seq2:1695-1901(+)
MLSNLCGLIEEVDVPLDVLLLATEAEHEPLYMSSVLDARRLVVGKRRDFLCYVCVYMCVVCLGGMYTA